MLLACVHGSTEVLQILKFIKQSCRYIRREKFSSYLMKCLPLKSNFQGSTGRILAFYASKLNLILEMKNSSL